MEISSLPCLFVIVDGIVKLRHLVAPTVLGQRDAARPQRGRRRHQEEEVQPGGQQRRAGRFEGAASAADPLGPAAATAEQVHLAVAETRLAHPMEGPRFMTFNTCR